MLWVDVNLICLCTSWICRKDWKLHGSATGGFFRCNIWKEEEEGKSKETLPAEENAEDGENDQGYGTAIHSAREGYRKKQDVNRFLHHYTRYEAHDQSAALERKMAETASTRLAPVVDAAIEFDGSPGFNFGGKGMTSI
jgi:ankyrin repeat/IBR domain-containing protein 1